ncbi:MAG: hypothetical protein Rsou_1420 [Candidatus Ruthia sp. Asou_11_S2]|nr:hypothetical protein [Candidatus Ruthia sp. Asou_11_S2]
MFKFTSTKKIFQMFFVPKINTTKNTINILGFLLPYKVN